MTTRSPVSAQARDAIAKTIIYGAAIGYRQADMVLASLAAAELIVTTERLVAAQNSITAVDWYGHGWSDAIAARRLQQLSLFAEPA